MSEKLEAMKALAPDPFCVTCLDSAIRVLADEGNVLRVNFYSTAMRIMNEHLANNLSPTDEVMRAPWFQSAKDDGRPTRKQRLIFAVQGGLSDEYISDDLGIDIGDIHAKLVKVVDDLSYHIHARESTIISEVTEQNAIVEATANAMSNFLTLFADCRREIVSVIEETVSDAAIDALLSETILEIDELANHHSIEGIYVEKVRVKRIGADEIIYEAEGEVSVGLQWGSNFDVRNGDGAEMDESFPFSAEISVSLEDMFDVSRGEVVYGVNTSGWHGNEVDEEPPQNWDGL
jgi:hypothetical protein